MAEVPPPATGLRCVRVAERAAGSCSPHGATSCQATAARTNLGRAESTEESIVMHRVQQGCDGLCMSAGWLLATESTASGCELVGVS